MSAEPQPRGSPSLPPPVPPSHAPVSLAYAGQSLSPLSSAGGEKTGGLEYGGGCAGTATSLRGPVGPQC